MHHLDEFLNLFVIDLFGCSIAEGLSRTVIKAILDEINVFLRDQTHIRIPWQIPANEPVPILHPALLLRTVGVTVVGVDAVSKPQFPMF